MAVEATIVAEARCVCTHSANVHGIKNDPGCSLCGCRHFERPAAANDSVQLGKYAASAFELLSQSPALKAVAREALIAFVKDGHGRMFAPGAVLVHRGDHSHAVYVVLNGSLVIQKDEDGDAHDVGPGEIAGDLRAFTEEPRSATVCAADNALALEVDTSTLRATFAQYPDFFAVLIQSLGKYSENPEEIVEATVQAALKQQTIATAKEKREGLDPKKQMEIAARWRKLKEEQKDADRAREAARAAIDSQLSRR